MRFEHTGNGARHARRFGTDHTLASEPAVRADVHVARCGKWRDFAVVECRDATIGHANHHVAATAEISSLGIRDCQRESGGDRGVDRVATLLHYFRADFRRDAAVAGNDRVRRERRARTGGKSPRRGEGSGYPGRNRRVIGNALRRRRTKRPYRSRDDRTSNQGRFQCDLHVA